MFLLMNGCTDPAYNLACEEYLFSQTALDIAILWRNGPSVIIGRNQDTYAEADRGYAESEGIRVIRRITGGGAVFHDLGNLNYTFITGSGSGIDFQRFCAPAVEFLRGLGLDASLSGRNDILVSGRKVSGSAQTWRGGRILHHGTLLYSADLSKLSNVLKVRPEKLKSKGISSVVSRVANISCFLENAPPVELFTLMLKDTLGMEPYKLSKEDIEKIERLKNEKYDTDEWTWGKAFPMSFTKKIECPAGHLESGLDINQGKIVSARFTGDFFGDAQIAEQTLIGCAYTPEAVRSVFDDEVIGQCFAGFTWEQLESVLF